MEGALGSFPVLGLGYGNRCSTKDKLGPRTLAVTEIDTPIFPSGWTDLGAFSGGTRRTRSHR